MPGGEHYIFFRLLSITDGNHPDNFISTADLSAGILCSCMPILPTLFRKDPKSGTAFPFLSSIFSRLGLRSGFRKPSQTGLVEPSYPSHRAKRRSRGGVDSYMELESGIGLAAPEDGGQIREVPHPKLSSRI